MRYLPVRGGKVRALKDRLRALLRGGEKKYEERHGQHLDRYYDEVIRQLTDPDELLIFGPGEAKLELKERLSRSKAHAARAVSIETADKLTDPQIVAKVKEHFGIAR